MPFFVATEDNRLRCGKTRLAAAVFSTMRAATQRPFSGWIPD
jgi:hypothetical protein